MVARRTDADLVNKCVQNEHQRESKQLHNLRMFMVTNTVYLLPKCDVTLARLSSKVFVLCAIIYIQLFFSEVTVPTYLLQPITLYHSPQELMTQRAEYWLSEVLLHKLVSFDLVCLGLLSHDSSSSPS